MIKNEDKMLLESYRRIAHDILKTGIWTLYSVHFAIKYPQNMIFLLLQLESHESHYEYSKEMEGLPVENISIM